MSAVLQSPVEVIAFSPPEIKAEGTVLRLNTVRGKLALFFKRSMWLDHEADVIRRVDANTTTREVVRDYPADRRRRQGRHPMPESWAKYHAAYADYLQRKDVATVASIARRHRLNSGAMYRAFDVIERGLAPFDANGKPVRQPVTKPNGNIL